MNGFGDLNMNVPLILVILICMSTFKIFMLLRVEHEKSFIS